MENMCDYKILIDSQELQQIILDYIRNGEFDKMFNSTVFKDNPDYRLAMIHGMIIASMLSSRCKYNLVKDSYPKIKVTNAEIVVHGTVAKPYYEIKYFTLDGECHIGYSSYDLKNVFGWLEECFEVVDTESSKTE